MLNKIKNALQIIDRFLSVLMVMLGAVYVIQNDQIKAIEVFVVYLVFEQTRLRRWS